MVSLYTGVSIGLISVQPLLSLWCQAASAAVLSSRGADGQGKAQGILGIFHELQRFRICHAHGSRGGPQRARLLYSMEQPGRSFAEKYLSIVIQELNARH